MLAAAVLVVAAAGGTLIWEASRGKSGVSRHEHRASSAATSNFPLATPNSPGPPPGAAGTKPVLSPEEQAAAWKQKEIRLAEQLVKEFPESEEPLVLLGDVHRRRGNTDLSANLWEKALQMNPRRADVYQRLARLAFDKDEYEKAIGLWRRALEVDPTFGGAHVDIARAMIALGQYQESIPEIQAELQTAPDTPLSYFLLGQAYQHLEDYENARQSYEKAVELAPDHTNAHYGLYTTYARLKETARAQQHLALFQKCKERDAARVRQRDRETTDQNLFARGLARLCVGAHELYLRAGNGAKVEALLAQAVELDPNNVSYLEKLVALYQAARRTPEALALCRRIERIDPNNTACLLNIGKLSALMGRPAEADKALQKVIALLPRHYAGYQELARLYLRSHTNLPRARELAEQAVALGHRADSYYVLGWSCDVNGDPAGALAALQKALELEPGNQQYAQLYERIRQREGSR
jgi:tetratricopeptide (TPR) repeat protein